MPSPRLEQAAILYASGAASSKQAACEAVGLSPNYLSVQTSVNPVMKGFIEDLRSQFKSQNLDIGDIINKLSHRAVLKIAEAMEEGSTEIVRLKAAVDLADRGTQTSKIQKHQVASLTLDGEDVEKLAGALVAAGKARSAFMEVASEGIDTISVK